MDSSKEVFTPEEKVILSSYVTNTDRSIFTLTNLPEVIKGALFSRYSRSTLGLRTLLLRDFIQEKESKFAEIQAGAKNPDTAQNAKLAIESAQNFYDRILDGYGDDSIGEFYSVALTSNRQQADTGTKMIHIGRNTTSTIISKGIAAGRADQTYRGQVKIMASAEGARNFTQCDSLLIGDQCGAHTVPYIEVKNPGAQIEHEATTSKISDDQLFYAMQRGLDDEEAMALIVNGFAKDVLKELPMEFAVEAQKLLAISLEGSVG